MTIMSMVMLMLMTELVLVGRSHAAKFDQLALGNWQEGRATFYGSGDGWSIDDGHCQYGDIPQPRYIAALSIWEGFGGDWHKTNCGKCFEVKCDPYSQYSNCRDDRLDASLIVMVTDKCPCNDWCCGDAAHFDLSKEAFGEIGNYGGGVIGLSWREINCPSDMGIGGELDTDAGSASSDLDPCYVHTDCQSGVDWNEYGDYGAAWYCSDGDTSTCTPDTLFDSASCDSCQITPNCSPGATWDENKSAWVCNYDPCYIHTDCQSDIEWDDDGEHGAAWYCSDGDTSTCTPDTLFDTSACDTCQIKPDCSQGATWSEDDYMWICNDGQSSSSDFDPCYIHTDCEQEAEWLDDGEHGPGWYCADGNYEWCTPDDLGDSSKCDTCQILPGCEGGATWSSNDYMWVCNYDPCYVHAGCDAGIEWLDDGNHGPGWFCADDDYQTCTPPDRGDSSKCDACQVTPGCEGGAVWDDEKYMWVCSTSNYVVDMG